MTNLGPAPISIPEALSPQGQEPQQQGRQSPLRKRLQAKAADTTKDILTEVEKSEEVHQLDERA